MTMIVGFVTQVAIFPFRQTTLEGPVSPLFYLSEFQDLQDQEDQFMIAGIN
jgi:hypothetical protein